MSLLFCLKISYTSHYSLHIIFCSLNSLILGGYWGVRGSFCPCFSSTTPPPCGLRGGGCGHIALYCPLLEEKGSWFPHTDTCPSHSQCRETHSLKSCTFNKCKQGTAVLCNSASYWISNTFLIYFKGEMSALIGTDKKLACKISIVFW